MRRRERIVLVMTMLGLTVAGCSSLTGSISQPAVTSQEKTVQHLEQPKPVTSTVRLEAIGDILIHSSLYKDAKTANGYDFRYMFEHVKPYLSRADLAFANQETMIGGTELGLSDYPMFNSPYEVGDALKDAGIDLVSIANNHTLDAGEQGILNATKHWDELEIPYVGAYRSEEDQARIRVLEKNGIRFAVLSYTYGTNGIPVPEGKSYLVNIIDQARMTAEVHAAKQLADVVVLNLHMGSEYQRMPNDEQMQFVQQMAREGVDIILGHHPHVLQPVQWVDAGNGKRSFVIYSLGNFISGQDEIYREIGGILQLEVEKVQTGDQSVVTLKNPAFLPVWTHKKNWRQYKLYPLKDVQESQLPHAKQLYQDITQHMKQWVPDLMDDLQ